MAAAQKTPTKPRGRHAKGAMPSYGSRTDVGLVRDHNEDSLAVSPPLFAVADGMGGHAAGEVASEIAIQTLIEFAPDAPDGDELARAVVEANRAIIRAAQEGRGRFGMGTTMTAALLSGCRLIVAQVGDSRAYLLHQGALQRITRDHSLMADLIESGSITEEDAKTHPQRSVITRALGSDPNTLPDIYEMNVAAGDRILLCSDGLSGMVDDALLESTLARIADPQKCANALVDEALAAGGYDNVTAVVVDVEGGAAKAASREKRRGRIGAIALALALIALLVGVGFGANAYLNTTAFVTVENGEVVICRGLPGSVLGIQTWKLDHATGVNVSELDLPTNTKDRLASEGIRADSVEEAEALVETWRTQGSANASAKSDAASTSKDAANAQPSGSESGSESSKAANASAEGGDAA